MKITMIIPAFNESGKIGKTLQQILCFSKSHKEFDLELIVVDDGSKDHTAEIAKDFGAFVLTNPINSGKGFSVKRGVFFSSPESKYVLFSDADASVPIFFIKKFVEVAESGFDVVVGSRAMPDSFIKIRQPWYRVFFGKTYQWLVLRLLDSPVKDTMCGFKLFERNAALKIFGRVESEGWVFDAESLAWAKRLGLRVVEVGVDWHNNPDSRLRVSGIPKIFFDLLEVKNRLEREQ